MFFHREFLLAVILILAAISVPVHGDDIFFQDFESGLSANESVSGNFSINNTNAPLNNGTQMMGHSTSYGPLGGAATPQPSYSYYDLTVDLTNFTEAELTFDFTGGIEKDFDGFNVLATTGAITPPNDLLSPTAASGMQYGNLTIHGDSSPELGPVAWSSPVDPSVVTTVDAIFDLSAFDGQTVNLRFQFGTDLLEGGDGANFDNVLITGNLVPEPSALGLAMFGLLGFMVRRRR